MLNIEIRILAITRPYLLKIAGKILYLNPI